MQITGQKKNKKPKRPVEADRSGKILASTLLPELLQPGMVVLRGALPAAVQQLIIDEVFAVGGDDADRAKLLEVDPTLAAGPAPTVAPSHAPVASDGAGYDEDGTSGGESAGSAFAAQQFYKFSSTPGAAPRLLLNQGCRGRLIMNASSLPREMCDGFWTRLCHECVSAAAAADSAVPIDMVPTVALVNFYTASGTFKEHVDSEHPDDARRGSGPPIVSMSFGDSCEFSYRETRASDPKVVLLKAGDVLLFGGPSRMIVHGVRKVLPAGRVPGLVRGLPIPGRLNVTLRDVRKGRVDTSAFPLYRVSYDGDVPQLQ
jgi:hypothetical protein